jgi:hypothetical protein
VCCRICSSCWFPCASPAVKIFLCFSFAAVGAVPGRFCSRSNLASWFLLLVESLVDFQLRASSWLIFAAVDFCFCRVTRTGAPKRPVTSCLSFFSSQLCTATVFYFLRARSPPAELFSATDFPHRFLQGDLSPRAWFFFCPRTRFVISCPCCQAAGVHRRNLPAAISSSSWFPRPIFIPAAGFQCRSVLHSLRFLRHAGGCFIAAEYSRPRRWVPSQPARTRSKFQAASFFGAVGLLQFPAAIFHLESLLFF